MNVGVRKKILSIFVIAVAALLGFANSGRDDSSALISLSFIVGAIASALADDLSEIPEGEVERDQLVNAAVAMKNAMSKPTDSHYKDHMKSHKANHPIASPY